MTSIEAAAQALLTPNPADFDVNLLDQVVTAAYNPVDPNRAVANKALMALQESPDVWTKADAILERAQNPQSRFFGLQVLDDAIRIRWKVLPPEQREGIKNYVVGKVIQISSDEALMKQERVFISKLNLTLVQILKQEWPHNWPSFIPDLVGSSKTSEVLCENNMQILKLLSEEVFDFSRDQMVTEKVKKLKESLNSEFAAIYHLCEFILEHSQRPSLLKVTLQTLQRFLTWIPLGFIFQTQLIDILLNKFFPEPIFRNDTLECLTEVGSLTDLEPEYDPLFRTLFAGFLTKLGAVFSPETELIGPFENGSEDDQIFIQRLALFLSGFFKAHLKVLETPDTQQSLITGLYYLVRVSEVDDVEIFRICLEAWHMLAFDLYQTENEFKMRLGSQSSVLNLGGNVNSNAAASRKYMYGPVLTGVRKVMIAKMAKPEEVLIVEDENGDIVRETTKDTDVIAQYKTMRETLVYLTHLNSDDTESIMLAKLTAQVDGTEWSWNNLNTLCWAIGSISGAMTEDEEKRFLVTVIKDLLGLCEYKRGKDNKAVVASNIMYVVGQYPRFLKAHWKFLKTVVNKLFEFMHEVHPGVQDMACDTFLKIATKCKRKFVTLQTDERVPFIVELVDSLPTIISDLEPHQIQAFYEACGCMLSDKGPAVTVDRGDLMKKLMELPNRQWKLIMDKANSNVESLVEPNTIKEIIKILKTNNKICGTIGSIYATQLQTFFMDLLNVYKVYSERISTTIAQQGAVATQLSLVRTMRSAKKEVLRLLIVFIEKSGPPESDPQAVAEGFIPPVLDPILGDYQRNIPNARDPEVLVLFTTVIEKLKGQILSGVPRIMEAVFECTLQMITVNFEDFPEHRIRFFEFIRAINTHCFQALFNIPAEHQKLVIDSVVWAMKHTERNISDTGLDILYDLLQNVGKTPNIAQGFYQQYLLALIQDVFAVMTDRLHKSGFKMHATLLRHMFHLVQMNQVTVPLFDPANAPPGQTNPAFLREHISNLLIQSFPNLTRSQVSKFVDGMFDLNMDLPTFKTHLRDFLIQLKEFSSEDNSGLFGEEQEEQQRERMEAQEASRRAVPGLLKPSEIIDDDL
ncbi:exportin1 [Thalassiosira pseudonana CCMP1335]|uniref:Exportin1 n=1 Tax=Thalassiosira pseudonana TaxID=35128 RepID=B8C129_THAPS|nr:exportin1 [Thalassiosira pseudonana CCMP1335]EED93167.1 exportin1 [Thalassiosira pseudonana CCMP1335]|eukprot:g12589.t1 g12589   contig6:2215598-2219197(+)